MRVLVGCEESGIVREAFRKLGHEAYSNDLVPARDNSAYHLQMDVNAAVESGPWDIIILFPPCTAMAVSGNSTYAKGKAKYKERLEAYVWTAKLWSTAKATAKYGVALENPIGLPPYKMAGGLAQYIHPYMFGHMEQKKTMIIRWGLPKLIATKDVYADMMMLQKRQRERVHYMSPGPNRARDRSATFSGIADAMATQWGNRDKLKWTY